jgi:hypothetical protein
MVMKALMKKFSASVGMKKGRANAKNSPKTNITHWKGVCTKAISCL